MTDMRYHRVLDGLAEAAGRTACGMRCLSVPLAAPGEPVWDRLSGRALREHRRFVFRQHFDLIRRVKDIPSGSPVLIREFSSIPLALLAPCFFSRRRDLFWLVNHNLQWAVQSAAERTAFVGLARVGFRFAFFETAELEPLERWRIRSECRRTLPLPVAGPPPSRSASPGPPWRVGLVGEYRKEKGMDTALAGLLDARDPRVRLRVGVPNPEAFQESPLWARRTEFEWVNTRDESAFRAFLSGCDVVLMNYAAAAYAYRPSGLLADAAAAGVAV
ncbi:MAG: hypothetical protein U1E27_03080, partial [Kiritimatiellia bacterium]|nr:hypothetical protein [Kiritimatiellia bacterium]